MKALSWKEPYGSLMLHGKIETRIWNTKIRGPILICTSQKAYSVAQVLNISEGKQYMRIKEAIHPNNMRYADHWIGNSGKAIAIGTLKSTQLMRDGCPILEIEDECFVKWRWDLVLHIYENVIALPKPFPVKGRMGFFNVPDCITTEKGIVVNLLKWYEKQLLKL